MYLLIELKNFRLLILVSLIFFTFCETAYKEHLNETITTSLTKKHTRIKGSKISFIIPESFKYFPNLSRIQKSSNHNISIIESPQSYFEVKENIYKQFKQIAKTSSGFAKKITINGKEAIYGEGYSKKRGGNLISLILGNEDTYVMIIGKHLKGNHNQRTEILDILKTIYFDDQFELNPLELADFEFSPESVGFVHQQTVSNMFIYTEPSSDLSTTNPSSIAVQVMPAMKLENAKVYLLDLVNRSETKDNKFKNKKLDVKTVGTYETVFLSSEIESEKDNSYRYMSILMGKEKSIVYICDAKNEDIELLKNKFITCEQTIKIK